MQRISFLGYRQCSVLIITLALSFPIFSAAQPCAANELKADSSITAVTVFTDRAMVTRTADLSLQEGTYDVRVGPLPSGVEPGSITAKGEGKAHVKLYGARLDSVELEQAQDAKVQVLETELQSVKTKQEGLRNTKEILKSERQYLDSIRAASGEQLSKELVTQAPSTEDAAALFAFLDEQYTKVFTRDQQANAELEALAKQQDRIQRELQELSHGRSRRETFILVELEATKAGAFQLAVTYRVPGATWEPNYEARVAFDEGSVELVSYGLIRQHTGEEWKDVQLTLSTAKPALQGSLPKLEPIYLTPLDIFPAARKLKSNMDVMTGVAQTAYSNQVMADSLEERAMPASVPIAAVATQGASVTYTLPKKASIASDWSPQKAPIASQSFKADAAYGCTPRISPYAFLRTKVVNATDQLLLPGPVSIFLDGAFISTASLDLVGPQEEFTLYLGVDERVKVERKPLKEKVEVSILPGLNGKTKTIYYEYLTTIENFTGKPIDLTVFDLVPVSNRKEIVVDEVELTPGHEDVEERPGVFSWLLKLAPKEKQVLKTAYRVRHPVDMAVLGL